MSQCLLGVVTKYFLLFKRNVRETMILRRVHQILGWTMPVLALLNLKFGWVLYGDYDTLNQIIYPSLGALIFIFLGFEVLHRWGPSLRSWISKCRSHKFESFEGEMTMLIETKDKSQLEILEEIKNNNRQ